MQPQHTICDLASLGLIKISGEKAQAFLQGQLTCNLDEISDTQTRLGAHCLPNGRVISLFRLFKHAECYFLVLPQKMIEIAINALKKYAVFFKVELQEVSEHWSCLGIIGDDKMLGDIEINEKFEKNSIIFIKLQHTSSFSCYLALGSKTATEHFVADQIVTDDKEWLKNNFLNHTPAIYPATSEKFLPHDINLPFLQGVSFTKGCYTGQEIIARMQYRAKLKNLFLHVKTQTSTVPELNADIYSQGRACGKIVDCIGVGYNEYELLVTTSKAEPLYLDVENSIKLELKE